MPLKPFEQWAPGMTKDRLVDDLQGEFAREFPGIGFNFSQYIQDNIEEGLSGVKGANSVKVIGPDLTRLEGIAEQIKREMDRIPGVADLGIFRVLGQPNLDINVDRDKAARYGLNTGDVNAVVQAALGGTVATTQLEADHQFNVTVRLAPEYRGTFDSVGRIRVGYATPSGANAYVPLSEIADISIDTGASYIFHERNERFIPINSVSVAATSGQRWPKPRRGSPATCRCRKATASSGLANSRNCSRPRCGWRWWCRSA